ncbi:MAG: hypothetical protein QOF51_968 [Chloroflexota bacterium]|jgi:hypothetical protein|nr:hypothetical protein [Chloroflexota bacterium]
MRWIFCALTTIALLAACAGPSGDNSGFRRTPVTGAAATPGNALPTPALNNPANAPQGAATLAPVQGTGPEATGNAPGLPPVENPVQQTPSGLRFVDIVVNSNKGLSTGQTVTVNYTGWLTDGTKFDSSVDRNQPFTFTLGTGGVIKAWDEGVAQMRIGEKRRLIVPPQLGYGARGSPPVIPPNATLIFDVEVLSAQ